MHRPAPRIPFVLCLILLVVGAAGPGCGSAPRLDGETVIVVGAGAAGLSAAYYLDRAGGNVVVLERAERAGGRTVSATFGGFTYALGTEYLGEPEEAWGEIVDELNLRPVEIPSPMDAVWADGEIYWGEEGITAYTLTRGDVDTFNEFAWEVQRLLRRTGDDFWALETNGTIRDLDAITAAEWLEREGFMEMWGPRLEVASRGLFGANLTEISALSYIPEIAFEFEGFRRLRSADQLENEPVAGEETGGYTFVTGIAEMTDAIATHLGDAIRYDARVVGVETIDGGYRVTYARSDGSEETVVGEGVVLAVPAPIAAQVGARVLADAQRELLGEIPYSSYATVALFSDEPIFDGAFDLAMPPGWFFTDIYDATWVQRAYDDDAAALPGHIATVYVAGHGYTDTAPVDLDDDALLAAVYADLDTAFPGASARVTGTRIQRFPYAYPVMPPGSFARLRTLDAATSGSVALAGDYMLYPTFDAAVQTGKRAAYQVVRSLQ